MPSGRAAAPLADTRVQFHQDQTHLLAVHETQIAIYEAPKLECLKQVPFLFNILLMNSVKQCKVFFFIFYFYII